MPLAAEKLANVRSFYKELNAPNPDGFTANAPLLLAIETTTRCNFNCVHCARAYANRTPVDIRLDLFQRIVPAVPAAFEVYLFGDGEVLLDSPRHLAMIARIHQEDPACRLGFSSNGKLLSPAVYELYATAGIEYIQLSVDAATKDLYEEMRRGGDFDLLVDNLEGIAALRSASSARQPALHLATVISKQNFRQLPLLADFAVNHGFSHWYINVECPLVPGRDRFRFTAEDLVELAEMRDAIIRDYSSWYSIQFDSALGLPANIADPWPEPESPVYCTVPWQRFELKANGDVKLCPYFHQPICAMEGRSLQDVWNGEEFRTIRRAFASHTEIPAYCVDCKLGMKKQFLPDSLGIPDTECHGRLSRMKRTRNIIVNLLALTKSRLETPYDLFHYSRKGR